MGQPRSVKKKRGISTKYVSLPPTSPQVLWSRGENRLLWAGEGGGRDIKKTKNWPSDGFPGETPAPVVEGVPHGLLEGNFRPPPRVGLQAGVGGLSVGRVGGADEGGVTLHADLDPDHPEEKVENVAHPARR